MIRHANTGPIHRYAGPMSRRGSPSPSPEKHCAVCGRRMEWRRKWARNWDQVKYCIDACRRRRNAGPGPDLEEEIVALLKARARDATLCPSEVARRVTHPDGRGGWRDLMEPVREAGRRLATRGVVVFRQKGRAVDPSTARGPVRIGRGPRWGRS